VFRHRHEEEDLTAARDLMHEVFADWRTTLARTSSARLPLGPIPERGEGSVLAGERVKLDDHDARIARGALALRARSRSFVIDARSDSKPTASTA
jgi:hypothetical protein